MPFSSTEISALVGGFAGQTMVQQQQALSLTQQFGGYSPSPYSQPVATPGENFSGMLMQGMGQTGMSVMGGSRLNALGGGLMNQMMYGVQQQQMLDANMRQAYRFPNNFGSRGFTGNDTAMIGSNLRDMSHMRGPGGETTTFEELGQLAANMGRMGMAEGVRSVKDFNEKFKQMLHTVKTVATELGTSLEEAQKVMASMKGAGIFGGQGRFAGLIRQGALAGNTSQAEMSAAALMGAQISRSIGGLGKSGAFAGVNTLTNIGAATQAGVMSEADIYNVTGLYGAEGRQAMTESLLSGDAQFFSSERGRRALAAMAGRNGQLDPSAVQQFINGGMSTAATMAAARGHTAPGAGRNDFMRNLGRLRGEAMKEFGGLGRAIVAKNWLRTNNRGVDMDDPDDRTMLLFQRQFNVGRDEADQIMKMANNLDTILAQRQNSLKNDQYMRSAEQADRRGRPEEIVKRLEMARNEINDGLRDLGANFYKSIATEIDEFMAQSIDGYVQRRRSAMAGIVTSGSRGGTGADLILARQLGLTRAVGGGYGVKDLSERGRASYDRLFGNDALSEAQFNRFKGANNQLFKESGIDISSAKNMTDISALQQNAFKGSLGFEEGGSSIRHFGGNKEGELIKGMLESGLEGSNDELRANFGKMLRRVNTIRGERLAREYEKASTEEQARLMKDIFRYAGVDEAYADRMKAPNVNTALVGSRFATVEAERQALGGDILGKSWSRFGTNGVQGIGDRIRALGGDASMLMGGGATASGQRFGKTTNWLADLFGKQYGKGEAHIETVDEMLQSVTSGTARGAERREAIGNRVGGTVAGGLGAVGGVVGGAFGGGSGALIGAGIGGLLQTAGGEYLSKLISGQTQQALGGANSVEKGALGEYLQSDEARARMGKLMTGNKEAKAQALQDIKRRRSVLATRKGKKGERGASIEDEGLKAMEAYGKLLGAGPKPSPETLQRIAAETGYGDDIEGMFRAAGDVEANAGKEEMRDRAQWFEGMGKQAQEDLMDRTQSDRDIDADIKSGKIKVGKDAQEFRTALQGIRKEQAGYTGDASEAGQAGNIARYSDVSRRQKALDTRFTSLKSVTERRKLAADLAAGGEGDASQRYTAMANIEDRLTSGIAQGAGGETEAVGRVLGAGLEKGEFKDVKNVGEATRKLMERMGLGKGGAEVQNRDVMMRELSTIISGAEEEAVGANPWEKKKRLLSTSEKSRKLQEFRESHRDDLIRGEQDQQNKKAEQDSSQYRELTKISKGIADVNQSIGTGFTGSIMATNSVALAVSKVKE